MASMKWKIMAAINLEIEMAKAYRETAAWRRHRRRRHESGKRNLEAAINQQCVGVNA